jgi:hypothetical protein
MVYTVEKLRDLQKVSLHKNFYWELNLYYAMKGALEDLELNLTEEQQSAFANYLDDLWLKDENNASVEFLAYNFATLYEEYGTSLLPRRMLVKIYGKN